MTKQLLQEGWCTIDPSDDEVLEAWALFCVSVAGKTASTTTQAINRFLADRREYESPFEFVRNLSRVGILRAALQNARLGQYVKLTRTFDVISMMTPGELRNWSPEQFETVHGIGPKTSRFFIQSTRENTRYAVLDTHILAWMREQGLDVPKSTPSKRNYLKYENMFLELADKLGMSPGELDKKIWLERARGMQNA